MVSEVTNAHRAVHMAVRQLECCEGKGSNPMWHKPANIILLFLACCVLADILFSKPHVMGLFSVSLAVFGGLLSRALLEEPQSVVACLLGGGLAILVICGNSGLINTLSGGWYLVLLLMGLAYALLEQIYYWTSL